MDVFWQSLITGISTGSIYALIGLGLGMIYMVSKIVNMAQGEFLTLGAFLVVSLIGFNVPLILAVPIAILITAMLGLVYELLVIRPAWNSPHGVLLIATVAVAILLKGVQMVIWGKNPLAIPAFSGEVPIRIGNTIILTQTLWVIGAIILVSGLSWYFFCRTSFGKAILAVSQDRDAAALVGINVQWAVRFSFAFSAAIGALGGAVVAPITFVIYDGGAMMGLKGFIALTLGGMESIWGGIIGGIFLGLIESFGAGFISAEYKDVMAFIVLIIVLYFLPGGILGRNVKKG